MRLSAIVRRLSFACLALALLLRSHPQASASREIAPGDDWCATIAALSPGDELVLGRGEHAGPCAIRNGGAPGAPIVIRGKDSQNPSRLAYSGPGPSVIQIHASHVVLKHLRFGPTMPATYAIRLVDGHDIAIEDNVFADLGGSALTLNHRSAHDVIVRGNRITNPGATAMYFGCHDGRACVISSLLVERNYLTGVRADPDEIGYGIQVKLNSTGIIRDNVIVNTKGPGIMVYGAEDRDRISLIEGNFVSGSRTSSAIVLGGGPAIVRNNIATSSAEGGIGLEDYARRGLLRGIIVVHNTVSDNAEGGITAPKTGLLEARILNNVAHARPGTSAFPVIPVGVESAGNVDCGTSPCFRDASQRDFSPVVARVGALLSAPWAPRDDYFGRRRETPAVAGAIERSGPPIRLEMKASR